MRPRILVAVPYEPDRPHDWPAVARRLFVAAAETCYEMEFDLALHPCPRTGEPDDGRFSPHARARNATLAAHLRPLHTHVLWADSDLISYPPDLPRRLLGLAPDGIAAPGVTLFRRGPERFYDLLGFIEGGRGARMYQPWFEQPGPVVELDSVGCIYLASADIYRAGATYADTPGYTEHWSVCQVARRMGRRVCADLRMHAIHAWLPDFGEVLH